MENGTFEDVFPVKNGDIPAGYVSLPEGATILERAKGPTNQSTGASLEVSFLRGVIHRFFFLGLHVVTL